MSRIADETLERRILNAGMRLWRAHGDRGLTLRAVAREASTTVPTVYARFSSKQELRSALAKRMHQRIIENRLPVHANSPRRENEPPFGANPQAASRAQRACMGAGVSLDSRWLADGLWCLPVGLP